MYTRSIKTICTRNKGISFRQEWDRVIYRVTINIIQLNLVSVNKSFLHSIVYKNN